MCEALVLSRKLKSAWRSLGEVTEAFDKLNNQVPESLRMLWSEQQTKALNDRLMDPCAMDIYDVQLEKGMF